MTEKKPHSRREFVKRSLAAAAGAAAISSLGVARTAHAQGSDKIKIALIGCGGRGSGAVSNCLDADPAVHVVALADAFEERAKSLAGGLKERYAARADLPSDRLFIGLDAYQKAIAAGPDLVLMATPPGFRPFHYAAAIEAGKNVFMEKPCCVDASGYRLLWKTNQQAEDKGLKVGVGFQRRHTPSYVENVKRIHAGDLGKITLLRAYWNGQGIWNNKRQPGWSEMTYQIRNWYHFCWLSGDNICEQHIHNLDVVNWVMTGDGDPKKAHPVEANGMGGCITRYVGEWKGTGQIFDHHFVEFTYADGTKMYSQCRHQAGTPDNVGEAAHGTLGTSNCSGSIDGKKRWRHRGPGVDSMVQEHKDLIAAMRTGKKYCEGWHGANSSMTAVLGRMATYSGTNVRWDEAIEKGTSEFPKELSFDAKAPVEKDKDGNYPIPVPGVWKPFAS